MKVKVFVKRAIFTVGIITLLASLGAAAIGYKLNVNLSKRNTEQAREISALKEDVRKLGERLSTSDAELKGLRNQGDANQAELNKLKDNVDAFATQAAACETLRRSVKGGA
ncbi:hypothetical protein KTD19_30090 [Burkholderia multivorans]|uniref:hypothetical protein n=1 Tax=Burkholderia cepacia complex TaxID=87882 RepID=UPI0009FDEA65|nr:MULTISPECIES: hypothetical protein [Burkholderia cepacia complex]MBU9236625.1 hypothetical protein [Burkholderia multivorans]MDC6085794.1 hypothetical protein [Burkholderia cenocepacia]